MGRHRPGEICIICEEDPCVCRSAKKAKRASEPKKAEASAPSRPSALEAMRQESLRPPPPKVVRAAFGSAETEIESTWRDAILTVHYLLGGTLMDDVDTREFRTILEEGPSPRLRAFLWREGNGS